MSGFRYSSGETPEVGDLVAFRGEHDHSSLRRVTLLDADAGRIAVRSVADETLVTVRAFPEWYALVERSSPLEALEKARQAQLAAELAGRAKAASSSSPRCVVCDDQGCEHCPAVGDARRLAVVRELARTMRLRRLELELGLELLELEQELGDELGTPRDPSAPSQELERHARSIERARAVVVVTLRRLEEGRS